MISGDTAQKIAADVVNKTPMNKSSLTYGKEEAEFRKGVEKRWRDALSKDPKTIMHISE